LRSVPGTAYSVGYGTPKRRRACPTMMPIHVCMTKMRATTIGTAPEPGESASAPAT
jgi:hypothetical protein